MLTGAGNQAFSAGQDIKLYFRANAGDAAARHKLRRASNNWRWQKLSTFPKPTIAMINGYCFGGAFTQVVAPAILRSPPTTPCSAFPRSIGASCPAASSLGTWRRR